MQSANPRRSGSRRSLVGGARRSAPAGAATPAGPLYAIKGARIFTAAGAPIDNGTILMRDGVIEDVGATVTVPADAIVIDGAGLNVYPGLIDMANDAPIDTGEEPRRGGRGRTWRRWGRRARRRRGPTFATLEEAERAKRAAILRPDFVGRRHLRDSSADSRSLASAGVTTVLAVPSTGHLQGPERAGQRRASAGRSADQHDRRLSQRAGRREVAGGACT